MGKRTWRKFREAAQKTRPTLLETTIGLDVVIPGEVLAYAIYQPLAKHSCLYANVPCWLFIACYVFAIHDALGIWNLHFSSLWHMFLQVQVVLLEQLSGIPITEKKEWQKSNFSSGCLQNQVQQLIM